jgi:hypothetical protein
MTDERTPEGETPPMSETPPVSDDTAAVTGDMTPATGETVAATGDMAAPSSEAPPPLAPYVSTGAAEPHAPLGNQATGAAGAYAPPPAAPQPAVAWAPPAAAAVAVPATGQRTVLAAIAGVLLLLGGILGGLIGLLVAVVGGTFFGSLGDFMEIPDIEGASGGALIGGVVAFFGIIILIYSLVYLFAGIGVLRNRGWGRVMGLIVGIISGLIWLSGLTSADEIAAASGGQGSLVSTLIGFGIHAYIVVVLLFFWRRKPATG